MLEIKQEVGYVSWNFEAVKAELQAKLKDYDGVVYTDEDVPAAKKDLAELRKLKKEIEDKRKTVKNACLAPYLAIEEQAKILTGLVDNTIVEIDSIVKEADERKKSEKRKQIYTFLESLCEEFEDELARVFTQKVYEPRWENTSTPEREWTEAIIDAVNRVKTDLVTLETLYRDGNKAVVYEAYLRDLSINDAVQKAAEFDRQKTLYETAKREEEQKEQKEHVKDDECKVFKIWCDEMEFVQLQIMLDEMNVKYEVCG